MQLTDFAEVLTEMHDESSRNTLQEMLQGLDESGLRILLGAYEDAGVGPATARDAAESVFGTLPDASTLEESLMQVDVSHSATATTEHLEEELQEVRRLSGNELKGFLRASYRGYPEPWLFPFALLGDYSTGVSETTVAKAYFPDEDHNRIKALNEDLAAVTAGDSEPATDVVPGRMLKPMLASPKDVPDSTGDWYFEPKLDGNRLTIHWDGDSVMAHTRRLNDVTHSLPELQDVDWPDKSIVLDCEVIAEDGTYKSTSERIGAKEFDESTSMEFHVFDCLYAGQDVTDMSAVDRKALAEKWVPDHECMSVMEEYRDIGVARRATADIEGFIAKQRDASYKLGKRSMQWRKEKNVYSTVDATVVDFAEGNGRHGDTLGKVRLESADGVDLGWCGSGFTDKERDDIWQDRDSYYNTVIEVQFADFNDKLREPTFQRFRPQGEPDTLSKIEELAG